jgi:hypothetical protein
MSGGAFGYVSETPTLSGLLVGRGEVQGIADALSERGHATAAAETEALLTELAVIEVYVLARAERLRDVWKATEWVVSGDWNEDDLTEDVDSLASAPPFTATVRIDATTGRITP